MAEGVGFEPTELSLNGFQDRRLKPLGHPSCSLHQDVPLSAKPVNVDEQETGGRMQRNLDGLELKTDEFRLPTSNFLKMFLFSPGAFFYALFSSRSF